MRRGALIAMLAAASLHEQGLALLVVGSQSILGSFTDEALPERATLSLEADVMYLRDGGYDEDLTEAADAIFGEGSAFHEEHGTYLQGVDDTTSVLPAGWRTRLVAMPLPTGALPVWCLDPHDLAVAKLAAGRPKDLDFVRALLVSGHLDQGTIIARSDELDVHAHPGVRQDVRRRLQGLLRQVERRPEG